MSRRLVIVVEGTTEKTFVDGVLAGHLGAFGVEASASIVGKVQTERRPGVERGGGHFGRWRADIRRLLGSGDKELRVSTLLDLFGLPRDFPFPEGHSVEPSGRVRSDACEAALAAQFNDGRFIPYVQCHEFEALVLAALPQLELFLDSREDLDGVQSLRAEIDGISPEDVDGGKETAPSKRLERSIPGYGKVLYGASVLSEAGLESLRTACPRFGAWLTVLEGLGRP